MYSDIIEPNNFGFVDVFDTGGLYLGAWKRTNLQEFDAFCSELEVGCLQLIDGDELIMLGLQGLLLLAIG